MRTIAVIVRATTEPRVAEALRAAVGLTLRGDHVAVALCGNVAVRSARIDRALGTLRELGHTVLSGSPDNWKSRANRLLRCADAVEVWT